MPQIDRENFDSEIFGPEYTNEIAELEEFARQKVSSTLSAIEVAVSSYEAAKKKPPGLKERIEKLKKAGKTLEQWERESLQDAREGNLALRIERLRKFTEICDSFA